MRRITLRQTEVKTYDKQKSTEPTNGFKEHEGSKFKHTSVHNEKIITRNKMRNKILKIHFLPDVGVVLLVGENNCAKKGGEEQTQCQNILNKTSFFLKKKSA